MVLSFFMIYRRGKSMQILVSDHFETYNRCPRAFYYKYILGFKVFQPKNKFALGKNIHALAAYKAKGMNIDKLLENLTAEEKMHFDNLIESGFFDLPQIASEWGFDVELVDGFWLNGRIDAVFEKSGKIIIVDWKTGENLPSTPEDSFQAMIYLYALFQSRKEFGLEFSSSDMEFCFVETQKPRSFKSIILKEDGIKNIKNKLSVMARKIYSDEVFSCKKNNCKFCDYMEICSY